jgi:hypothetical protein
MSESHFHRVLKIVTDPLRDEMVLRNDRERSLACEFDDIHVSDREGVAFAIGRPEALDRLSDAIVSSEPSDAECRAAEARAGC